jgi:hypothetical protein
MTTEHYALHVTTSGPLLRDFTPEMVHRAETYAAAHAETVRQLWQYPFVWEVIGDGARLRLQFPIVVRGTLGSAVTDWVTTGEGDMPDPHQFV